MVYDTTYSHHLCIRDACTIQFDDKVVVTGGTLENSRRVSVYNIDGWVEDLPDLNEGRSGWHGCGHYVDSNNDIVRLVELSIFSSFSIV